ncbi:MAG: ATP synthase F1 subunit gamma [Atopobiaceae bacterium]|jgi:F-type H+-transporting ATPase subunit gamma
MPSLREIKGRISSVSNTLQVTRTMEMISTARIRKALARAQAAAPYKDAITLMLANVAESGYASEHPLLMTHAKTERVVFLLIASDRGMAGGFNVAPQREVLHRIEEFQAQGVKADVITCGKKPTEFFHYRGIQPVLSFEGTSSEPTMDQADRIASYLMDGYESGQIDRVMIYYSHAKNRVDQAQVVEQLLPITHDQLLMPNRPRTLEALSKIEGEQYPDFEFDPSAVEVLGYLLPAYVRTVIFHALLDSAAAEHGARRRAMKSASDSAEDIITSLSRTYNRERQGSITTELNEIVAGASALEENN